MEYILCVLCAFKANMWRPSGGLFMPHLSHGKTKTNVSTYLARSEIQAILGAFIILWSDQQYN